LGNVLEDHHDASGLLYRRNRYYNPQTGRFTQEDPIGLAGGLNAYGFANGDPASFSDPYGLKVCFQGADYRRLADSTMTATGTTFSLDSSHCAENVQDADGKLSYVSRRFIELANDTVVIVSLEFGVGLTGGSGVGAGGVLYIDQNDVGGHYGTQWVSQGVCSGPPNAVWDLASIIAHEVGHGYGTYFTKNHQHEAVRWENEVHHGRHRPARSQSCHVK
jgi:RHS repeat-associated protein